MEIRHFALRIVQTNILDEKLFPAPADISDNAPGPALRLTEPGRPDNLSIHPAGGRKVKVPPLEGMADISQRRRILHALANHELQAVELFAWALLAFPDAPADFRRGLLRILGEEQRHVKMYTACLERHGGSLGDHAVTGYFWNKVEHIQSPLHFISAMSLTFENANLDHTVDYAAAARAAGDEKTALVVEKVQQDEIGHVRFGWEWLQVFKQERTAWDAFRESLTWPLRPLKARGRLFNREARRHAGMDDDFIDRIEASTAEAEEAAGGPS